MKRLVTLAFAVLATSADAATLETLTVPAGATEVTTGQVVLEAGTTYTLKVSGTYEQIGRSSGQGATYDALFCVALVNDPQGQTCSDHFRGKNFAVTTDPAGPWKDIDAYGGPAQSYSAGHEYTVSFEPPTTGVLRAGMSIAHTHCTTCETNSSGAITVEISGPGGGTAAAPHPLSRRRSRCSGAGRALLAAARRVCGFGIVSIVDTIEEIYDYEASSPRLPANTKSVEVLVDVQNPDGEKLFEEFVVAVVKARKRLRDQLDGCVAMGSHFNLGLGITLHGQATVAGCMKLIWQERERDRGNRAAASASGCGAVFIPAFRRSAEPSRSQVRAARARMQAGVRAGCDRPAGTQLHARLQSRGGSLNGVVGPRVRTAVGKFAPEGATFGDGARLAYGWGFRAGR